VDLTDGEIATTSYRGKLQRDGGQRETRPPRLPKPKGKSLARNRRTFPFESFAAFCVMPDSQGMIKTQIPPDAATGDMKLASPFTDKRGFAQRLARLCQMD